ISLFFYIYVDHRDIHSFPTRRSSDLAEDDIRGIVEWYAEQSKQLPSKFLLKLSIGLDSITKNPEHYQKRFDQVRIHFLKKFPYRSEERRVGKECRYQKEK